MGQGARGAKHKEKLVLMVLMVLMVCGGDGGLDGGGEPDFDETRGEETVDREKRARSVADDEDGEHDGGTKRVRLGAAAEVEEL